MNFKRPSYVPKELYDKFIWKVKMCEKHMTDLNIIENGINNRLTISVRLLKNLLLDPDEILKNFYNDNNQNMEFIQDIYLAFDKIGDFYSVPITHPRIKCELANKVVNNLKGLSQNIKQSADILNGINEDFITILKKHFHQLDNIEPYKQIFGHERGVAIYWINHLINKGKINIYEILQNHKDETGFSDRDTFNILNRIGDCALIEVTQVFDNLCESISKAIPSICAETTQKPIVSNVHSSKTDDGSFPSKSATENYAITILKQVMTKNKVQPRKHIKYILDLISIFNSDQDMEPINEDKIRKFLYRKKLLDNSS
jgi:hypothetical protein